MNKTYIFELPISVMLPRKRVKNKKVHLNMNQFVNYSRFTVNDAKQLFIPISMSEFKAEKIKISYYLEKKRFKKTILKFVALILSELL